MTNKAFPRAKRIAQQIQQTLSELIRRELRDPRLGMVTLTEVRVSKDLSYAKVYFSVLGAQPQQAQEILEAASPLLRGPLGRALGDGSAGNGVHHWWVQRVTSVALIPLTIWFAVSLLSLPSFEHALLSPRRVKGIVPLRPLPSSNA